MKKPTVHLICNAHLDPVWQWRWEEGCAEALSTFGNAVQILKEDAELIFNHNEAVLYRWVKTYDPALFREIQRLVRKQRWCISGGWYLQPDANLPGTESLVRQMTEGKRFFKEHFGIEPEVAYNFDSFGHSGGLPQLLRLAGYKMYIHMRPQAAELLLPSDLYRWKGVDGSEILTYRIAVGLYHTERDNIEQRLQAGTELALRLNRDVPVFWGIGNHGGGATREDLDKIRTYKQNERRVEVVHSTSEAFYRSVRHNAKNAPLVEGDLQRVFTGCYTSLSRIKRGAHQSLGAVTQTEALCAATWWLNGQSYPKKDLDEAWRGHLFNDFHDILPGSCTELAEHDALDLYGRVLETMRRVRISAATSFNMGTPRPLYIPVTVLNTNPSCSRVPVEAECMLDLRPKWSGIWHLQLFTLDGKELPCQEEQPESLLPFNGWRRKVSFVADLPQVGAAHYELRITEGENKANGIVPGLQHTVDPRNGLIFSLDAGNGRECLTGYMMQPLMVDDDADSWGTDRWSYRDVVGQFSPITNRTMTIQSGPVRAITQSVFLHNKSRIVLRSTSYPEWPVIEFRLRIYWNEPRKRLTLSIPTVFRNERLQCEIPGGAIARPADAQEHVHGRWCLLQGKLNGRDTALGIVNSGQHGLDYHNGEVRLSILRSAAYCHEQGFKLGDTIERKYMDIGVHDVRVLVTAGDADLVRSSLAGLADWLSSPPAVYSHLPIGAGTATSSTKHGLLSLTPSSIRMTACKQSWDGKALIVRLHETLGQRTRMTITVHGRKTPIAVWLNPFELKTLRIERNGRWKETDLIHEE
jgi:alpha-mannosidase